jgi:pyruvate ferredoxin oxidoreductase beta subunit
VVVIGGDGGTFDIGFGALSGMLERGDDVLYICVDNGAYMNTGGQRSAATPLYASTTTDPAGKISPGKAQMKKDLPAIVAAHGAPYVATASAAFIKDLQRKVKKAMTVHGPRYIQIDTPCPGVWGFPPDLTLEVGRLGVNCGLVPLFEMEQGKVTSVRKIPKKVPVTDYIKAQGRFKHLLGAKERGAECAAMQEVADRNVARYGLVRKRGAAEERDDQGQ